MTWEAWDVGDGRRAEEEVGAAGRRKGGWEVCRTGCGLRGGGCEV